MLISKINSQTGDVIWTYQYLFYNVFSIAAFERKLLEPNKDVIVAAFGTTNAGLKIRYIRLIIDPNTGEPINSAGDLYWEGTGLTDTFELLGITIENEQSARAYYYDGD